MKLVTKPIERHTKILTIHQIPKKNKYLKYRRRKKTIKKTVPEAHDKTPFGSHRQIITLDERLELTDP